MAADTVSLDLLLGVWGDTKEPYLAAFFDFASRSVSLLKVDSGELTRMALTAAERAGAEEVVRKAGETRDGATGEEPGARHP